jgi:hypothetical protein
VLGSVVEVRGKSGAESSPSLMVLCEVRQMMFIDPNPNHRVTRREVSN